MKNGGFLGGQVVKNCLPMQGTWVKFLVQEDPRCCGATKPKHCSYWVQILQPLKPVCLEPMLHKRSCCKQKPRHPYEVWPPLVTTRGSPHQQWRSRATKNKNKEILKKYMEMEGSTGSRRVINSMELRKI